MSKALPKIHSAVRLVRADYQISIIVSIEVDAPGEGEAEGGEEGGSRGDLLGGDQLGVLLAEPELAAVVDVHHSAALGAAVGSPYCYVWKFMELIPIRIDRLTVK